MEPKKKNIIINAFNKIEIPIICIASGLFTQKKKEKYNINFYGIYISIT